MKTIKQTYHDALYFAEAKINKKESFSITSTQKNILEKLIHYEATYSEITFKNETIAKHLFCSEYTIKDSLEDLYRKGYLTSTTKFHTNYGSPAKSRVITINWDKLQEVLNLIESKELAPELINEPVELSIPEVIENTPEAIELAIEAIEVNKELLDIVDSYFEAEAINEEQREILIHLISTNQFSTKTVLISEIDYYNKENLKLTA